MVSVSPISRLRHIGKGPDVFAKSPNFHSSRGNAEKLHTSTGDSFVDGFWSHVWHKNEDMNRETVSHPLIIFHARNDKSSAAIDRCGENQWEELEREMVRFCLRSVVRGDV